MPKLGSSGLQPGEHVTQGWTEDELTEVLIHLTGYVGVPIIREAMLVAARVFSQTRRNRQ